MERSNRNALQMLMLTGLNENTKAIRMNLLTKSGLKGNNVERDLNILRNCVLEAGRHLREDGLQSTHWTATSKWITWPRASATTVAT